jgi:hypothetical protein
MAGPLQQAEHHDPDEIANVKTWRRTVEPNIGRNRFLSGQRVESSKIGTLMDKAAALQYVYEV